MLWRSVAVVLLSAYQLGAIEPNSRIPELQRNLRAANTVVLAYRLAPQGSVLRVITGDRVSEFVLPGSAELKEIVEAYNRAILNRRDLLGRDYPVRRRLYQAVLQPAVSMIRAGAKVVIVPDGCLNQLNFETLVIDGGRRHYWIEDVTVSVAPSLDALRFERPRQAPHPNLLFIGDPSPPGNEYGALPHLKEELEAVERAFPDPARSIHAGQDAYPQAYRQADPGKFFAIHFAAHAKADPDSPLNSAVILSNKDETYKLYAKDVLAVPIDSELVTISACRTAGPKSFPWAFLQAGARHVVAGLWDVDDAAASRLMGRFYRDVAQGRPPGAALRAAKLELLRLRSIDRLPYFWGPFEVFTRIAEFSSLQAGD